MFFTQESTKGNGSNGMAGRARDAGVAAAKAAAASKAAQAAASAAQVAAQAAGQTASSAAQSAAQSMNLAAQSAAAGVGKGIQQGVFSARGWAAPMLDNAAEYTTSTLAPAVSTALHGAAAQVKPPAPSRNRFRSMLTWTALSAAVAAALGAAAVLVRKRYQTAMDADTEADAAEGTMSVPPPTSQGQAGTTAAQPGAAGTAAGTDAGVNGRVSSSGL